MALEEAIVIKNLKERKHDLNINPKTEQKKMNRYSTKTSWLEIINDWNGCVTPLVWSDEITSIKQLENEIFHTKMTVFSKNNMGK